MTKKPAAHRAAGFSLSKKSSNSWAFSHIDGIMKEGEERCWNEEKRIEIR